MGQNTFDVKGDVIGVIDGDDALNNPVATSLGDDQKKLRALIERRHPEYEKKKPHWDFLEATYEGGREWFDANIFQYVKEGQEEFAERKRRAYRFNHTREVVDLLNKYLFRQAIARNEDDAPDSVKEFWQRSTKNGLGISDFKRQISKMSSIFGRIAIVVDNNLPSGAVSVAEVKNSGAATYAYIVRPQQLLDYSHDERGDLNWALIAEAYRDDESPMAPSTGMSVRWRLWTKTEWILLEERGVKNRKRIVVVASDTHDLGEVPVIIHDNIISDEEWSSQAMIDDIAYLDRAVANYLSNLDAIIQDQTFSQLAMPAQGLMPGEDNYNKMLEMGTKRIFLFDGEGGIMPTYISPDVKQAQVIVGTIQKIINEIYHTVGLAGERTKEDNAVGIDNSSGVAKAYDFDRVNSLLVAKADSLEVTENKINRLVALWSGEEKLIKEPLTSYPADFDTRGLYDEFDIAARLILTEAPDEVRREQMRQVIEKLFPQAPATARQKMEAELKTWPPEPEIEVSANGSPKSKATSRQGQVTKKTV